MSYEVNYEGLDPIQKHNKAIEDIRDYLGPDNFQKFTREFKRVKDLSVDQFTFYASLVGVEGYPVKAWYNYCFGM